MSPCGIFVVCVSVMDHSVLSAMFFLYKDGSYFKNCRKIVMSLVLSRQEPYLHKSLYETLGVAHV